MVKEKVPVGVDAVVVTVSFDVPGVEPTVAFAGAKAAEDALGSPTAASETDPVNPPVPVTVTA